MKLSLLAVAAVGLSNAAFIKVESKTTINNDNSGKFSQVMELNLDAVLGMFGGGAAGKNPMMEPANMLSTIMGGMAPNVDVWESAKGEKTKLGATRLSMTGFTKDWLANGDLKKMLLDSPAAGSLQMAPADIPEMKIMNVKDEGGNKVITFMGVDDVITLLDGARKAAVKEGKGPKAGEIKVSREEIAAGLEQARPAYAQYKGMAAMMLKDVSVSSEMTVSGEIIESAVFKKTGPNTVAVTFSGTQLIELVDQILQDEDLPDKVVALAKAADTGFADGSVMPVLKEFLTPYMKTIYGGDANPRVVFKPGANAFDYAAESAKAKAAQTPELKELIEKAGKARSVTLPGGTKSAPEGAKKKKAA